MRTKVAHLLRKYDVSEWGGTETALLGLCEGLRRREIDSVVYGPAASGTGDRDPLVEAGCRVQRYSAHVPIWGLSAERKRQLRAIGGNLMSFDLIPQLVYEPEISVIHAHTAGRIGGIGRLVARWRRIPFVITLHGGVYDLPVALQQAYASPKHGVEWGKACGLFLGTRRLLSEADAVLVGNAQAATLIREKHPGQRVVIHPHGIPTQLFRPDHRTLALTAFPRIAGREVLLTLGRIDPAKNQAWLLEQLPELVRRHSNLLLVLAGAATNAGYLDGLNRRIRQLGLDRHVLLTGGFLPNDPRWIGLTQSAQAVVLPSLAETFGLVILEAWAAGTLVIASRTAGASSLIDPGRTGLLFDLAEPAGFHAGVDRLLGDTPTVRQMTARARKKIQEFDVQALADKMKLLYEGLIEAKGASTERAPASFEEATSRAFG